MKIYRFKVGSQHICTDSWQKNSFRVLFCLFNERIKSSSPIKTNAIEVWNQTLNYNLQISHTSINVLNLLAQMN